jgi:hypothetical protein
MVPCCVTRPSLAGGLVALDYTISQANTPEHQNREHVFLTLNELAMIDPAQNPIARAVQAEFKSPNVAASIPILANSCTTSDSAFVVICKCVIQE